MTPCLNAVSSARQSVSRTLDARSAELFFTDSVSAVATPQKLKEGASVAFL